MKLTAYILLCSFNISGNSERTSVWEERGAMGLMGLGQLDGLVEAIKSKVGATKRNKPAKENLDTTYAKMEKSSSTKEEIQRRKARRLIEQTLKAADLPGKTYIPS